MKTYAPILTLEVHHGYYQSGRSGDLGFETSASSQELIKGYRLRLKQVATGFQLFAPMLNGTAFIDLPAEMELSWQMKVHSPRFWQITELPAKNSGEAYSLSNTDESWGTTDFGTYGGMYQGRVEEEPNQTAVTSKIKGGIRAGISPDPFAQAFGSLQIRFAPSLQKTLGLSMQFEAKHETWRYFIVTTSAIPFDQEFSIEIQGNVEPFVAMNLDQLSDPLESRTYQGLFQQYPGQLIYGFRSTNKIAFQERPNLGLILKQKKNTQWTEILTDLPAPTSNNHGLHIVTHPIVSTS
ncbi:MAG: hypothetical protein AAF587_17005 [Bacteroidota bacterium]